MGQVKNFFVNYRRRFNLDEVLQEWEAEQGTPNGESVLSAEDGKNSNSSSGKSTDEEEDEVRLLYLIYVSLTDNTVCMCVRLRCNNKAVAAAKRQTQKTLYLLSNVV